MEQLAFSPIGKSISFYTRNDFAILNSLLFGCEDELWKYALLAYGDDQRFLEDVGPVILAGGRDYYRMMETVQNS